MVEAWLQHKARTFFDWLWYAEPLLDHGTFESMALTFYPRESAPSKSAEVKAAYIDPLVMSSCQCKGLLC